MSYEPSDDEWAATRADDLGAAPSKKLDAAVKREQPQAHRELPYSAEAEMGVLSSMMLCPPDVCSLCALRKVQTAHFYNPQNQLAFTSIMGLWDRGVIVDAISITADLRNSNSLDKAGGPARIFDVQNYAPTAANIEHYLDLLTEHWAAREMIQVANKYANKGYDLHGEIWNTIDSFESDTLSIRGSLSRAKEVTTRQIVIEALASIQASLDRKGITGLSTGFSSFDGMTDGLQPAQMIVIAARPSMGKTALAMNMAEHIALNLRQPVAVYSLEMSSEQLMQRLLASRSRVNISRMRNGVFHERDIPALSKAGGEISEAPLFFNDTPGLSIQELRADARRLHALHGIKAIFVDYIQLLRSLTKRGQADRQLEVGEISAGLKGLSKELNIPIVVLAQLNRAIDARGLGGKPRLSDLRESGSIEQDADIIGFLIRQELYAERDIDRAALEGKADLIIAKQRNGPIGEVPLMFLKEFTRFECRARDGQEEERSLL